MADRIDIRKLNAALEEKRRITAADYPVDRPDRDSLWTAATACAVLALLIGPLAVVTFICGIIMATRERVTAGVIFMAVAIVELALWVAVVMTSFVTT